MRRPTSAAVVAGIALTIGSPFAAHAQTTPAPEGSAEGSVAAVKGVLGISESSARAGGSDAEASATVVRVGDKPFAEGLHAKSKGKGRSSKSVVDLSDSDEAKLGRVRIGASDAESDVTAEKRSAAAAAAVARIFVTPFGLQVHLLESSSKAEHTEMASSGSAFSNGARVEMGERKVEVLHSDVSSSGEGSTYLVGLDGTKIGETSERCTLTVPGVAGLSCLSVAGGEGSVVTATVLGVDMAPKQLDALDTSGIKSSATRGRGTLVEAGTFAAESIPAPASTSGALARTGTDAFTIIAGALLLTALGALALQLSGRQPSGWAASLVS